MSNLVYAANIIGHGYCELFDSKTQYLSGKRQNHQKHKIKSIDILLKCIKK